MHRYGSILVALSFLGCDTNSQHAASTNAAFSSANDGPLCTGTGGTVGQHCGCASGTCTTPTQDPNVHICPQICVQACNCPDGTLWDDNNGCVTPDQCPCLGGVSCDGFSCTDTKNDAQNCGACGKACAAGQSCTNGQCLTSCTTNSDCGQLQYCSTPEGQCGARGVCAGRGINVLCTTLYQPVCGCDGKTYSNGCQAMKAGAALDHDGICQPACDKHPAPVDGDTLAEQPWTDASQTYFYTFTGNGTFNNNSGTFVMQIEWPCLRTTPRCAIATPAPKTGSFYTYGTTLELDYDSGDIAFFNAQVDCKNIMSLVGNDQGHDMTLTVSPILP